MGKQGKKRKKRKGGAVIGVGALAIAALLAFDPFGFGLGSGLGIGIPTGGNEVNENNADDQNVSVTPEITKEAEETPAPTQTEGEVTLKELAVEVNANKILYNGAEAESAQSLATQLATEYADEIANVLVKINLNEAVYDTVEELKLALEGVNIKYEMVE